VCEEVATCYQLVATRRPKAVLDVEFDEQFESEGGVTLAGVVQEIHASLGRCLCLTGWRTVSLVGTRRKQARAVF
jgi:hypothetical protein